MRKSDAVTMVCPLLPTTKDHIARDCVIETLSMCVVDECMFWVEDCEYDDHGVCVFRAIGANLSDIEYRVRQSLKP